MRFERENRYIVLKITDLISAGLTDDEDQALASILDKINLVREGRGRGTLVCVVVESDWPEYEPTWKAIEDRVRSDACPGWNSLPTL